MKNKLFKLFVTLMIASWALLACSSQTSATPAPTNDVIPSVNAHTPPMPKTGLSDVEVACWGLIGYSADGKMKCSDFNYIPTADMVTACQGKSEIEIAGEFTSDGEPFTIACTEVMDAMKKWGFQEANAIAEAAQSGATATPNPESTAAVEANADDGKTAYCGGAYDLPDGSQITVKTEWNTVKTYTQNGYTLWTSCGGLKANPALNKSLTGVPTVVAPAAVEPTLAAPITGANAASVVVDAKPLFSVLDTTKWEYAAWFFAGCTPNYHGIYINRFDTLYVYPDNQVRLPNGGKLTTGSDEVILFATGNYRDADPTHNGAITKFCVEGDTGIWLLPPNSMETIKTGLVYVTLTGWNGETQPRDGTPLLVKGDVRAEACQNRTTVVEQIQANMGTEEVFALLDDDVNINPDARFAWGWDAVVQATAGKSMVWTRTGEVGLGWSEITSADGKSLYVANKTGNLDVTHPFSGLQLCSAYPGYDNLTAVTAAKSPSEGTAATFTNQWFADVITAYRGGKLFEALGLVPSVVYERGTHETKWNTFVITSAGVTDPNLMKITELNTLGGYRVLYFVKTDSVTDFSADFAVITVPDPFSPADVFDWWLP